MVSVEELRIAAHDLGIDKGENGFYDWQEEIIWDRTNKRILMKCGRKVSKTTIVEARDSVRVLNDDIRASGVRGGICITGDESQGAQDILQGVSDWLFQLGWEPVSDRTKKDEQLRRFFMKRDEIQMPNGNRILVITSKWGGRTIRKYSFHEMDVDEADLIPNEYQFYSAIRPCLARYDGVFFLNSTPNIEGSRKTYFNQCFYGVIPGWKIYHIPTTQVPHIPQTWIDSEYPVKDVRYIREILAQDANDINAVFPEKIIMDCFTENAIDWTAENAFIGAQYASFQTDSTVIAENFFQDKLSKIRIGMIPHYGRRITEAENQIVTLVNTNGVQRVVINTTLGTAPLESMAELIGQEKVVGVANNEMVREIEGVRRKYMREDLYVNALKLMERQQIIFEDRRILDAFMEVRYEYNKRTKQVYIIGNDITDAIVRALFPVWGRSEYLGSVESLADKIKHVGFGKKFGDGNY